MLYVALQLACELRPEVADDAWCDSLCVVNESVGRLSGFRKG